MKRRRAVRTTKLRSFKATKTRLYRPKIIIKQDLGKTELIEVFSFPELETSQSVIPKEKNPHLIYVMRYPIRMAFYLDKGRGFIYDEDNRYLGSFDIDDLVTLAVKINDILDTVFSQNSVARAGKLIYTIGESDASK